MATSDSFHWAKKYLGASMTVYPGHSVVLATMVMMRYPDFATASRTEPGKNCPNALQDGFIPGAGCAVYAALRFLEYAQKEGLDAAYDHAERYWKGWENQHASNVEKGLEGRRQAILIQPLFEKCFAAWGTPQEELTVYRLTSTEKDL